MIPKYKTIYTPPLTLCKSSEPGTCLPERSKLIRFKYLICITRTHGTSTTSRPNKRVDILQKWWNQQNPEHHPQQLHRNTLNRKLAIQLQNHLLISEMFYHSLMRNCDSLSKNIFFVKFCNILPTLGWEVTLLRPQLSQLDSYLRIPLARDRTEQVIVGVKMTRGDKIWPVESYIYDASSPWFQWRLKS